MTGGGEDRRRGAQEGQEGGREDERKGGKEREGYKSNRPYTL